MKGKLCQNENTKRVSTPVLNARSSVRSVLKCAPGKTPNARNCVLTAPMRAGPVRPPVVVVRDVSESSATDARRFAKDALRNARKWTPKSASDAPKPVVNAPASAERWKKSPPDKGGMEQAQNTPAPFFQTPLDLGFDSKV